jgi:V/A-type H+-transporting ATPase subunit I
MAVLQMQRISVCGLKKERKKILETLQRIGAVEVDEVLSEDNIFTRTDMSSSQTIFEKSAATAQQALDLLDKNVPEKKSKFSALEGKKEIAASRYYVLCDGCDDVMKHAYHVVSLEKEIAECKANIVKLSAQIDALEPWMNLDVPMEFKGTKKTAAFIGSFPFEIGLAEVYEKIAQASPEIGPFDVNVISTSKEQTCVFVVCKRTDADKMEDALRVNSFAYPSSAAKSLPTEVKKDSQSQIDAYNAQIEKAQEELDQHAKDRSDLEFMVDYYTMRAEKYGVISRLLQSRRTFILTGYVPEAYIPKIETQLNDFDVAIEYGKPDEKEDVPVLLKNNKFTEPAESVLTSFGLPKKGEIDPTSIVAVTYYILFGMMLSDAAYGFIVASVCGIFLLKFKKMASGTRNMLKLFFFCGVSTLFWGIMFSGYFGDIVDVISSTFFGKTVSIPPVWFKPLEDPMRMLIITLAIGIVHIFIGLGIQFYQLCRAKRYKDAIYDVGLWVVFVLGLIFLFLPTEMFQSISQMTTQFPPFLSTLGKWMALAGMVGIIATGGRESKSPVKRILMGLYSVYNVTGYLSDILSYSRLLALGLATGVIASVVNQIGIMVTGNWVGIIIFVIIFIGGHLFNIAISGLGAYVHSNRLEFVEFFSRFYEGGGRAFEPFKLNSKYYQITEESKNE